MPIPYETFQNLISEEMGISRSMWKPITKIVQFKKKMTFYPNEQDNFLKKLSISLFDIFATS
jgi:hypothetical protein